MRAENKVTFQFFNTPDNKFYGPLHSGVIVANVGGTKPYRVKYKVGDSDLEAEVNLHPKEIKSVIK